MHDQTTTHHWRTRRINPELRTRTPGYLSCLPTNEYQTVTSEIVHRGDCGWCGLNCFSYREIVVVIIERTLRSQEQGNT